MRKGASLARSINSIGILCLTLSAITPAASVFVIVPEAITEAGTGSVWSMALAGLLAFPVALVYAELSSAMPITGGEYCIVGRVLGDRPGIVVLGLCFLGAVMSPAALALGISEYIAPIYPAWPGLLASMAVILVASALGAARIRTNAWFTSLFLLVELLALAVLTILGFLHPHRDIASIVANPVILSGGSLRHSALSPIIVTAAIAIFAYDGYGSAIYFSEETEAPEKSLPRAILSALIITLLAEMLPLAALFSGSPDLKATFASLNPFGDFIKLAGGRTLTLAFNLAVAISIANAILVTVMQNARFFYSTARDATWSKSVDQLLLEISPRLGSPWLATLVSGLLSALACLLGLQTILIITGTSIMIVYGLMAAASFRARNMIPIGASTYRMPLFPLMPAVALAGLGFVLVVSLRDADGRWALLASLATILLSLVYHSWLKRRGKWQAGCVLKPSGDQ